MKCAACAARAYPVAGNGTELPVDVWRAALAECPLHVRRAVASGMEPTMYRDLAALLDGVPDSAPVAVESNMIIDPQTWVTDEIIPRLQKVRATLHHYALSAQAERFWKHVDWLSDNVPGISIDVGHQAYENSDPASMERVCQESEARGLRVDKHGVCDVFLWRERMPYRGLVRGCDAGQSRVTIAPDGTAYRCQGQAAFGLQPLGNIRDGWDWLLDAPADCECAVCSCTTPDSPVPDPAIIAGCERRDLDADNHIYLVPQRRLEEMLGVQFYA